MYHVVMVSLGFFFYKNNKGMIVGRESYYEV
ncbi:hypothetical protein IIK_03813 [Bacillus cereus VD102]|uniref:Uncharacterized protein n=1 Tax=Bacillus paranthracis TaxID=2026186 RepID=A0A9X8X977_9BACI|nr:hypothetical protein IIK_03813 [Bacillus cereus VD102]SME36208.1 hypothetical protein BACERE00221_04194 [Bacillus paranthracis]